MFINLISNYQLLEVRITKGKDINLKGSANKEISDFCYPVVVKMGKEMKNGTLVLNVIHGKEMEIEYKKHEIIA